MTEEAIDYKGFNEAMAKFQGDYEPPKKDKKVDFTTNKGQRIKYEYSDLESLQKAIRTTASKHGLSWNTDFEYKEMQKGLMIIAKVVINHSSGTQKTFSGVPLIASSTDPQSIGSIKTYSERYALGGAFGIASDSDDDGQIGANKGKNQNSQSGQQQPTPEENAKQVEVEINKYKTFLRQNGKNLDELDDYIADKENMANISHVDRVKVMGYYKAFATKQRMNNEQAAKNKMEQHEQGSMMQGNTTTPINWGNK